MPMPAGREKKKKPEYYCNLFWNEQDRLRAGLPSKCPAGGGKARFLLEHWKEKGDHMPQRFRGLQDAGVLSALNNEANRANNGQQAQNRRVRSRSPPRQVALLLHCYYTVITL